MSDHEVETVAETLAGWAGERVSVRVVAGEDDLLAVFTGRLGELSSAKHPALFWPVETEGGDPVGAERPGIYLHANLLEAAELHTGGFVLEFVQAGSTLNVRLLKDYSP